MNQLLIEASEKFKDQLKGTIAGMILADCRIECSSPQALEIIAPNLSISEFVAKALMPILDLAEGTFERIHISVENSSVATLEFPVDLLCKLYSNERENTRKMIKAAAKKRKQDEEYRAYLETIAAVGDYAFLVVPSENLFEYLDYCVADPKKLWSDQPDDIIGQSVENYLPDELAKPRIHYLKKASATGNLQRWEFEFNGSQRRCVIQPMPGREEIIMIVRYL
jgi:hypothetical protein